MSTTREISKTTSGGKQTTNPDPILTIHTLKYISHGSSARLIAVINGIPMYQSTGRNSNMPNTWLPFLGINDGALPSQSMHWLMKPHGGHMKEGCSRKTYPIALINLFLDYIKQKYKEPRQGAFKRLRSMLARFGDLEAMAISASIGQGFWTDAEVEKIRSYVRVNYKHLGVPEIIFFNVVGQVTKHADKEHITKINSFVASKTPRLGFFSEEPGERKKIYRQFTKDSQERFQTMRPGCLAVSA